MKEFESIIKPISEEEKEGYQLDPEGQKIVQINNRTGEVVTGYLKRWRDTTSYYLVSNSLLVHQARYSSPKFSIEDKNGGKIEIQIKADVNCPPGNEAKLAQSLYLTGQLPSVKLDRLFEKFVAKFRKHPDNFIENYFAKNLDEEIEEFITASENTNESLVNFTGLKFLSAKCSIPTPPPPQTISVTSKSLEVGFKGSVKKHTIIFNCDLSIDHENAINAHSDPLKEAKIFIKENVQEIFKEHISEDDMFKPFTDTYKLLEDKLDEKLRKHGRKITAIEYRNLYILNLKSKSLFEFKVEKNNLLALDREDVHLNIVLRSQILNIRDLVPFKDNPKSLKNKLQEKVEIAIKEFIKKINSGEFYANIESNQDFQNRFIQAINNKTNEIINNKFTIKDIDIGRKSPSRNWTTFEVDITCKNDDKCSITGSFIVTSLDLTKQAFRESLQFDPEDLNKKVIETIKAWLTGQPREEIVFVSSKPEIFEKALENKLFETVLEAYGVHIKVQNILIQPIKQTAEIQNIDNAIRQINDDITQSIFNGGNPERRLELEKKKALLNEHQEKLKKEQNQPAFLPSGSENSENTQNANPFLKEVYGLSSRTKQLPKEN